MMHFKTKWCSKTATFFRQLVFNSKDVHGLYMTHGLKKSPCLKR